MLLIYLTEIKLYKASPSSLCLRLVPLKSRCGASSSDACEMFPRWRERYSRSAPWPRSDPPPRCHILVPAGYKTSGSELLARFIKSPAWSWSWSSHGHAQGVVVPQDLWGEQLESGRQVQWAVCGGAVSSPCQVSATQINSCLRCFYFYNRNVCDIWDQKWYWIYVTELSLTVMVMNTFCAFGKTSLAAVFTYCKGFWFTLEDYLKPS